MAEFFIWAALEAISGQVTALPSFALADLRELAQVKNTAEQLAKLQAAKPANPKIPKEEFRLKTCWPENS